MVDADLTSVSAHKMYGPKGAGALIVRGRKPRLRLAAQMDGGGHEFGMRSGTLNVPAIVGFGEACAICAGNREAENGRVGGLRNRLKGNLEAGLDGIHINGSMEHRLPGNLNVSFEGVDSEALLVNLHDLALSTGSACTRRRWNPVMSSEPSAWMTRSRTPLCASAWEGLIPKRKWIMRRSESFRRCANCALSQGRVFPKIWVARA